MSTFKLKNIIIQNEINPDKIVIIKFFVNIPIEKAIIIAITFGHLILQDFFLI